MTKPQNGCYNNLLPPDGRRQQEGKSIDTGLKGYYINYIQVPMKQHFSFICWKQVFWRNIWERELNTSPPTCWAQTSKIVYYSRLSSNPVLWSWKILHSRKKMERELIGSFKSRGETRDLKHAEAPHGRLQNMKNDIFAKEKTNKHASLFHFVYNKKCVCVCGGGVGDYQC